MILLKLNGEDKIFSDCTELNYYLRQYKNSSSMRSIRKQQLPIGVNDEMMKIISKETQWIYVSGSILRGKNTGYSITLSKNNGVFYINMFKYSDTVRELATNAVNCFSVKRNSYSAAIKLFTSLTKMDYMDDRVSRDVFLGKFRDSVNHELDYLCETKENSIKLSVSNRSSNSWMRVCSFIGSEPEIKEILDYVHDYVKRKDRDAARK